MSQFSIKIQSTFSDVQIRITLINIGTRGVNLYLATIAVDAVVSWLDIIKLPVDFLSRRLRQPIVYLLWTQTTHRYLMTPNCYNDNTHSNVLQIVDFYYYVSQSEKKKQTKTCHLW